MAFSQLALLALLASGEPRGPTVLTADQVRQPHGAAPVMLMAATTPTNGAAASGGAQKPQKKTSKKGGKKPKTSVLSVETSGR